MSRHANYGRIALLVAGAWIALTSRLAPCQTCVVQATSPAMVVPAGQMPAYEVATIKPWDGKGFAPPLRIYIQQAFGISPNIIGSLIGPDWINSTRYAIQGKPPDSIRDAMQTMTTVERARENALMQQSLLADRFHLKAHFETREKPVYELVQAKGGSKLIEDSDPTKRRIAAGGSMIRVTAAPIHNLIDTLECAADIGGREVIDKTGLAGTYDFSLKWTPQQTVATPGSESTAAPSPDAEGASLFTAIEEQLGLKLVPARGSSHVLVIDHIDRPSEN